MHGIAVHTKRFVETAKVLRDINTRDGDRPILSNFKVHTLYALHCPKRTNSSEQRDINERYQEVEKVCINDSDKITRKGWVVCDLKPFCSPKNYRSLEIHSL